MAGGGGVTWLEGPIKPCTGSNFDIGRAQSLLFHPNNLSIYRKKKNVESVSSDGFHGQNILMGVKKQIYYE